MSNPIQERFNFELFACLTWKDRESGVFISHCLNYDLKQCGDTYEEAWQNLKTAMKHHIEHCWSRYPAGLQRRASKEEWQKFYQSLQKALQENPKGIVVEEMKIDPLPPLPELEIPVWIQGVKVGGDGLNIQ
jgi:predicted RNase H-like HicB family nuclease